MLTEDRKMAAGRGVGGHKYPLSAAEVTPAVYFGPWLGDIFYSVSAKAES